jgi:hypothetical protein
LMTSAVEGLEPPVLPSAKTKVSAPSPPAIAVAGPRPQGVVARPAFNTLVPVLP